MAHHAPRPTSVRPAPADRTAAAPRPCWSRCTTTVVIALAGVAVVTVGVVPAHASPPTAPPAALSIDEIERRIDREWNTLEPVIEQHNATRQALAGKRRQAAALAARIEPLKRQVDQAMSQVDVLAVRAYKGESASALNVMLTSRSPALVADHLEVLDQFARRRQAKIRHVVELRDQLTARKAPLDRLIVQLSGVEKHLDAKRRQIDGSIAHLQKLRLKAYGGSAGGAARPVPCPTAYVGGAGGRAATFACAQLGKPYVWGAEGPDAYDCSGLTLAAWSRAGVRLPHNAAQQRRVTARVDRSDLRPGDLVFYYADLHHVGMYVGGGWIVHASRAGAPIKMKRVDDGPVHSFGRPAG
ncbi:C40 family peptidase [Micromonospora sp. WMMD882]|uniref:C40 family peptidase n=1 Tax=Micromonospora sp. WMMD882 TaxID=3015151 RepID=UPI00248B55F1|nr:C40 family peptidase [Micromonospora sp. WMMD882]WBB78258.1 C40 family peptidase [Micromonospora sp. WMMD882]